jgi:hypothetical protein
MSFIDWISPGLIRFPADRSRRQLKQFAAPPKTQQATQSTLQL